MEHKTRNVSMDLLRILSMLMIVTLHSIIYSNIQSRAVYGTARYALVWGLEALVLPCANLFIMISGYFLISRAFHMKSLARVICSTWIISVVFYLVACICGRDTLGGMRLVWNIFPILTRQYWYVTNYVALYLLSPFICLLLKRLTKKQYQLLLAILLVIFSVWPTLMPFSAGLIDGGAFGMGWFTTLFILGGYLRLFGRETRIKSYVWILISVLMAVITFGSRWVIEGFTPLNATDRYEWVCYVYNSVPVVVQTYCIFQAFLQLGYNPLNGIARFITQVSSTTFGVYLLHEHYFLRTVIWSGANLEETIRRSSTAYVFRELWIVPLVFAVCSIAEFFRQRAVMALKRIAIFKKLSRLINLRYSKIDNIMRLEEDNQAK